MDLATNYLGLRLKSPLVVGASGLAVKVETVRQLEAAGAGMVVMHSLFEEQFAVEQANRHWSMEHGSGPEAITTDGSAAGGLPDWDEFRMSPDEYYELIATLKKNVRIPVVGSINGVTVGNWVVFAQRMEQAGADAIELNIYDPTMDPTVTGLLVEQRALEIVKLVRRAIRVPLAVKLSPYYSSFAHLAVQLDQIGADGLVLFNRFLQPDINVQREDVFRTLRYSTSDELLLRLRWTAALFGRIKASIAVTGGVHNGEDVIKSLLAGASVVQMASCLLEKGATHLLSIQQQIEAWRRGKKIESLSEIRGKMSILKSGHAATYERVNYVSILAKDDD